MVNLDTPLKNLPKITPKYAKVLSKLGLHTVQDLLLYFPFRYDDFSQIASVDQKFVGQDITVEGKVAKTQNKRLFPKRMTVTEIVMQDGNNIPLKVVWFNQPFILDSVKVGSSIRVSGKLQWDKNTFCMISPSWERADREATNTARMVPVYPETNGLTSKWLRWQIMPLLPLAKKIPDFLPDDIRDKYNLYSLGKAVSEMHFPVSQKNLIRAQKTLAFREIFLMQLQALKIKKEWEAHISIDIKFDEKLIKDFVSGLPFKLTNAQRKACYEILKDLEKPKPMNRLLNGDVGSGKTVVAATAALQVMSSGYQTAIMAPTEVLAYQHFLGLCELFSNYDFNIALLTNSYKLSCHCERSEAISQDKHTPHKNEIATVATLPRNDIIKKIYSGEINLIIGTHALIQKDVEFENLALVVIDEQHRFGVAQRAALQQETLDIKDGESKTIPHLLTMTATPIPRTLAIAFFGSLDLSILDEMPKNRRPIKTEVITPDRREEIYDFIRKEITNGRQAFIVLPFVEESKAMTEVKAAIVEHEKLSRDVFSDLRLGLLHGRLKAKEKEEVMQQFKDKELDILVSTPVVEVGIDVPNATVMIIENSERFGLAQLHQFRGRVGRGQHQSYCFLFTDAERPSRRLQMLAKSNDGFKIAEYDLELRGPGQFFGTVQSGIPDIAMKNLSNVKLIKFAREEAQNIIKTDPELKKHPLLADVLRKFSEKIHLE